MRSPKRSLGTPYTYIKCDVGPTRKVESVDRPGLTTGLKDIQGE